MKVFRSACHALRRAKAIFALTLSCAFVGCAYFGFTLFAGILPFSLWFAGSALFWPLWFVVAGAVAVLAILWLASTHFARPCYC